jgi:hypothetical protein
MSLSIKQSVFLIENYFRPLVTQFDQNPDFFLWGHLKNNFYSSKPRNLEELRLNVTNEVQKISVETA